MKLRMTHNSIRIRVRKSELAVLAKEGLIEDGVHFPTGQSLRFAVEIASENTALEALLEAHSLRLQLPRAAAQNWIQSQEVGLSHAIELQDGEQLHLLIEKDFSCLDRAEENVADTFWELAPEKPESC